MAIHVPKELTIVFANCNSDRRLLGFFGDCYPELKIENRIDRISALLIDDLDKTTILILFELDEVFLQLLINKIKENKDYHFKYAIYNNSDLAFRYLVISKIEGIVETLETFPLTKSGKFVHNKDRPDAIPPKNITKLECDVEYIEKRDLSKQKYEEYKDEVLRDNFDKSIIKVSYHGNDIYCVHLGLSIDARMNQTMKIIEIVKEESVKKNRNFVIGGDFNSFDTKDNKPITFKKQLKFIKNNLDCVWLTNSTKCTFDPFPYDIHYHLDDSDLGVFNRLIQQKNIEDFKVYCKAMALKYETTENAAFDHIFCSKNIQCNELIVIHPKNHITDHYIMKVVLNMEF